MAIRKIVGQVLPEERDKIQQLFERRNGLNELARIVTADSTEPYEKLVKDLGETGTRFQQWWNRMAQKYQWEGCDDSNWEINFNTCDIYLVGGQCDECNAQFYGVAYDDRHIRTFAYRSLGAPSVWR